MFDLPEAKRVRREDLISDSDDDEPDLGQYGAAAQARLKDLYAIDEVPNATGLRGITDGGTSAEVPDAADEDAFDFRLFTAPKADTEPLRSHAAVRIAIRSPTPDRSLPGFLVASKPASYYFTGSRTAEELERFRTTAMSSQDVMHESTRRWPGSELPWRLVTIKPDGKRKVLSSQTSDVAVEPRTGRKRDGKKRRIAVRKKVAALRLKQEQEAMEKAAKEAAEKEKRTQRNREKKVKKKARDKAKKASVAGEIAADPEKRVA